MVDEMVMSVVRLYGEISETTDKYCSISLDNNITLAGIEELERALGADFVDSSEDSLLFKWNQ